MDDKRTRKRKFLKLYLELSDLETGTTFGHLVDVTRGGGMATSERPIETGAAFQLRLKLPAEIKGARTLDFSVTTAWTEKDSESDFYNTGFSFDELTATQMEIVTELMEKYCF